MRHTKDFYSELALNSIHSDQVDGYVKKFGELYLEEEKEWISSKIVELLNDQDKVIDIGCGTGRYLKSVQEKSLARKKNINLYGIDISEETIERYTVKYCPNRTVLKSKLVRTIYYKNERQIDCKMLESKIATSIEVKY